MKMTIRGIGTDIIEITRIEQAISRYGEKFLHRIFTSKEIAYCSQYTNSFPHFAGRFAGKEAIAKALGIGFGKKLSFLDIEILPDSIGKPQVKMKQELQHTQILLSISHSKDYATAVAIWE